MDDERAAKRVMKHKPVGKRKIGRPKNRWLGNQLRMIPVSYTHLDVYKRQDLMCLIIVHFFSAVPSFALIRLLSLKFISIPLNHCVNVQCVLNIQNDYLPSSDKTFYFALTLTQTEDPNYSRSPPTFFKRKIWKPCFTLPVKEFR